ncbi:MAG: hypothetical protein KDG49_08090, partial [Geminicoccaceae bacterium]|nr:hypothetical protein [Geminicoccaceae bacterium]
MAEDGDQELQMRVRQRPAEIRDLADLPEQAHPGRPACPGADVVAPGQHAEAAVVERVPDLDQARCRRVGVEALVQGLQAGEIEIAVAPAEPLERQEIVGFHRLDDTVVQRAAAIGRAERAVRHVPPGPAGDLADLGGREPAVVAPVELVELGEGDMDEVHVEAHADGVCGNDVVDIARLIEGHLGIAGART